MGERAMEGQGCLDADKVNLLHSAYLIKKYNYTYNHTNILKYSPLKYIIIQSY